MKMRTKRRPLFAPGPTGLHSAVCAPLAATLLAIGALLLTSSVVWRYWERQTRAQDRPPIQYTITPLGTGGGQLTSVEARFINNRGQVTGNALLSAGGGRAFLWENGRFKFLESPEVGPRAVAVNNHGTVLATTHNYYGDRLTHVVLFHDGKMTDTGIVGNGSGIDDRSRVVGVMQPPQHAFLYDRGKAIDLGTLGRGVSTAQQINNAGQIVGTAGTAGRQSRAFLYSGGKMRDLGTLGGSWSIGDAMNSKGWVVGLSQPANGGARVFLFRDGKMEAMVGLFCTPVAINAGGTVVGNYNPDQETSIPIVWVSGHKYNLQDLIPPDSGWTFHRATSINDRGQIVVEGVRVGDRYIRSCILTPTTKNRSVSAMPFWRRIL